MRFSQINKNKPDAVFIVIKNDETSASLTQGQPVGFSMDGTDNGLAVQLIGTLQEKKALALLAGIVAETSLGTGKIGLAQVYGYCQKVNINRVTRSATDATWPTAAAVAVGDLFKNDTANNDLVSVASIAASAFLPWCAAAQSLAAITNTDTLASVSTGPMGTGTAWTSQISAFLRML